jgi:hypothetical protein
MNKGESEPQLSTENIVKIFREEMQSNKDFLGFTATDLGEHFGSIDVSRIRVKLRRLAGIGTLNKQKYYDKRCQREVTVYSLTQGGNHK